MLGTRDRYGLDHARLQAAYSKDPSTQVGAAILRPDGSIAGVGRNGFPKGIADTAERLEDRDFKLDLTIHAEENAILLSAESVRGFSLYVWPWAPCCRCAARIVQAGLAEVVVVDRTVPERWTTSMDRALTVLAEGGVALRVVREEHFPDR